MATIQFTDNRTDLSSGRGYQFRFFCQKCGNGYMSTFRTNTLGAAAPAASAVSSLLGGLCGRAAQGAEQLQAQAARDQVVEQVKSVDYVGQRDLARVAAVNCPSCGARTQEGKLCPECGRPYG